MKFFSTCILAAGFVLGSIACASAIDFKVKGEWDFYFNFGQTSMYKKPYDTGEIRNGDRRSSIDAFDPVSRVRLQIEAAASENLSGTLQLEMGNYGWGNAESGAALGQRSVSVKVKRAYMDWLMPNTDLRVRMGLQDITLPNAAGGSAVLDEDVMAVAANYRINDNAGVTALWLRPYNDNYDRGHPDIVNVGWDGRTNNSFDNVDLGMLAIPLTFDGLSVTPWGMFGQMGRNAARYQLATGGISYVGPYIQRGLFPVDLGQNHEDRNIRFKQLYASMVWAGIPIQISAFDPFNFELDANYGYMSGFGRYDDERTGRRNDSRREGFVLKGLAEYKTDWGVPGVFGWYGSGDSGNLRNGSGRMPYLAPVGTFSSFGRAGYYGDFGNLAIGERVETGYSGTWAVGAQIKDLSFLDDLSHTLRAIYWRGTNDPAMARALRDPLSDDNGYSRFNTAWNNQPGGVMYLTTNDYLVEFNLDSSYQIYENLEACVELGYIVNGADKKTWKWSGNQKEDAWKAALNIRYSF
jgi:hypothetical protein